MLNRPSATWSVPEADRSRDWDPDRAPGLRLSLMWLCMLIPLVAVVVRMGQLQIMLQQDFADGFEQTYEVLEEIPARHGRILAADGSVLAGEEARYDLQMNYRLIQQPADERWLRGEALRNLDRVERKDKQKVAAEKDRVLKRREELWEAVSKLTGRSSQELAETRLQVQNRVVQLRKDVLRQRAERQVQLNEKPADPTVSSGTGWASIWTQVRKELTEPPTRSLDAEPLIEEVGSHTIVAGVDADVKAEIEAHRERYPGLRIDVQTRRVYPQGELASHLIGSRTLLLADEAKKRQITEPESDLRIGDPIGRSGLELKYDAHLRGVRGQRRVMKNRRGDIVSTEDLRQPRHGRDLVLTLDMEVQRRSEQLLDEALATVKLPKSVDLESSQVAPEYPSLPQGACIVAIDVHSGAVLAAASAPRFDLNLLVHPDRQQWKDLMEDPRKPLYSRATQMALPPGSVFKVISAVAAVESGKVDPDIPIACRGYLDRPDQHRCQLFRHRHVGHGDTRLGDALCYSCNVYFFTAARRMGPEVLVDWSTRFGIGQKTGIDLPSEGAGHLPSPDEMIDGHRRRWHPGDTLGLVIGQADLLVTPLQMVRAMAAIANGGQLVTPHLAGEVGPISMNESPSFRPVFSHPEPRPIEGLHRETLAHVREGLEKVVNRVGGTAFETVKMKEIRIAGKTGTAESGSVDHAWFAGYVPAEQPRVAFVVVLEQGGGGGKAAGPVAKKFVSCLLDLGLVTPVTDLVRE
jgi:penicillin-binding protein 2